MSFRGFTDDTFSFFMALRFNNNREFFHGNHDWYAASVRGPALELAAELSDAIESLDPDLERRPDRVLSRLNRDLRFSRDKTPYRDYFWLSFHAQGEERHVLPEVWFDLSAEESNCGIGIYDPGTDRIASFRGKCVAEKEKLTHAVGELHGSYAILGQSLKRIAIPDEVPEALRPLYRMKGFYLSHPIPLAQTMRSDLPQYLAERFREMTEMYHILKEL